MHCLLIISLVPSWLKPLHRWHRVYLWEGPWWSSSFSICIVSWPKPSEIQSPDLHLCLLRNISCRLSYTKDTDRLFVYLNRMCFFLKLAKTKVFAIILDIGEYVVILVPFKPSFFPIKRKSDSSWKNPRRLQ